MTYLDLVNKVLTYLRRNSVLSVVASDDAFVKMVGMWVQQAAKEVESAWLWHPLRTSAKVTMQAGIGQYIITDGRYPMKILSVYNDTKNQPLQRAPSESWINLKMTGPLVEGDPLYYAPNGVDDNGDPIISLWPIPVDTDDIIVNVMIHSKIALGAVDDDTLATPVPWDLVVEKAKQYALLDRGTLTPQDVVVYDRIYLQNLQSAIMADSDFYPFETGAELI